MDISFDCDSCGEHLVIDEAGTGLTVQCPQCGQDLSVPKAVHTDANPPRVPPPIVQLDTNSTEMATLTHSRKAKHRTGIIIAVGCVGVSALLALLVLFFWGSRATQAEAHAFIGVTEQELIRRLGQPGEIRTGNAVNGEPYRMLCYDNTETNGTLFIIFKKDGMVWSGSYRGIWFSHE